jgi:hypothetical protein
MANTTCPENMWSGYQYTGWGTCDDTLRNIINHEINTNWYNIDWCAGSVQNPNCSTPSFSNWTGDVGVDIEASGAPAIAEVMTCDVTQTKCLSGWNIRADHFQAISQYDPTDQLDKYGETGNAASQNSCNNNYVPGAWTGTWNDPQTGANFNDNWGWDYVSNQFHWNQTREVTW